jgi:hypothetical protein
MVIARPQQRHEFSEEHFEVIFGDIDLGFRLHEAGWRTGWTPHAEVPRHELPQDGRRADGVRFDRDNHYLRRRWSPWLKDNPTYNPNMTFASKALSPAWPPRQSVA